MADSLEKHAGDLLARGTLARLARRVATFGFHLATLDVREHAAHLHLTVSELFQRVGVDYDSQDRERPRVVAGGRADEPPSPGVTNHPARG